MTPAFPFLSKRRTNAETQETQEVINSLKETKFSREVWGERVVRGFRDKQSFEGAVRGRGNN